MTTPILTTKLYIPPNRPKLVHRPRLFEKLNQGLHRKLALISSPAGFGKSTLLSSWVPQIEASKVAWLSLDEGDNDLTRFLTYFVAALQTIESKIGHKVLAAFQSPGTLNSEIVLTTLLNEIAESPGDLVLILDDYHVIDSKPIGQALTFLLDHSPTNLHLVIATRIDPPLPLARLRARGQMIELRTANLRFTLDEVAAFLNQVMDLELSTDDIAALETRTEGWIAGLQMAAVSMRGLDDIAAFIKNFAGDHRHIVDYLVDEVLAQCSPAIRDFLLETAILERMSAPLCDALTGESDGQATLEKLEGDNLFTIPLDQRREWYRYHHLFADLLRHRLTQIYPERIEDLHTRASHWLDERGFPTQAIKHALAIDDKWLAADLIEVHAKTLLHQGSTQVSTMLDWFDLLPKKMIHARPLLHIYQAWTLVFKNPFKNKDAVEQILTQVEGLLKNVDLSKTIARTIAGHIASMRGLLSQPPIQTDHDPHAVLALFHDALRLFPPDEVKHRCSVRIGIAYEYMHLEDTEAAIIANQNAYTEARAGDNHLIAIVSIRNQAWIAYCQGLLEQAIEICQKGIASFDQLHTDKGQIFPGLGILFIMRGYFLLELGELKQAEIELAKGFDLVRWIGEYEALSLWLIALVRLSLLRDDDEFELQIRERYERHWSSADALVETLRVQAGLTHLESDSSSLNIILDWMEKNQPDFEVDSDFQGITPWAETRHIAHLTWIKAQIALAYLESVHSDKLVLQFCLDYLNRRIQTAELHGLGFRVIECSVLSALVLDAIGKPEDAVNTLSQALILAEPEGFRRVFLDNGQPMIRLLQKLSTLDKSTDFVCQLLAAFEIHDQPTLIATSTKIEEKVRGIQRASTPSPLLEPLTDRELEVLHLIAKGLTYNEIASQIMVSLNTVRTHVKNIYSKLFVHKRSQAIAKAKELNIL
jgi:LuxR family maltose regulon positive regulatory protein